MDDLAAYRGFDVLLEEGKVAVHLVHHWPDNAIKVVTKTAVSLNAWHQVTVAYDGSGKAAGVKVFVDGKPEPLTTMNDTLKGTIRTEKALHLGKRQLSIPFKGKLDDVRFFGVALTAENAADLTAGRPVQLASGVLGLPAAKLHHAASPGSSFLSGADRQGVCEAQRRTGRDPPAESGVGEEALP